jgi:hypothetical protein
MTIKHEGVIPTVWEGSIYYTQVSAPPNQRRFALSLEFRHIIGFEREREENAKFDERRCNHIRVVTLIIQTSPLLGDLLGIPGLGSGIPYSL